MTARREDDDNEDNDDTFSIHPSSVTLHLQIHTYKHTYNTTTQKQFPQNIIQLLTYKLDGYCIIYFRINKRKVDIIVTNTGLE